MRGHELTTRAELFRDQPDHPRAKEPYYKLQLGPLERLPRPILARKWHRLTFLYTTGERLLAAEDLNDLVIQSEERELLWKALRERGLQAERHYETQQGLPQRSGPPVYAGEPGHSARREWGGAAEAQGATGVALSVLSGCGGESRTAERGVDDCRRSRAPRRAGGIGVTAMGNRSDALDELQCGSVS